MFNDKYNGKLNYPMKTRDENVSFKKWNISCLERWVLKTCYTKVSIQTCIYMWSKKTAEILVRIEKSLLVIFIFLSFSMNRPLGRFSLQGAVHILCQPKIRWGSRPPLAPLSAQNKKLAYPPPLLVTFQVESLNLEAF